MCFFKEKRTLKHLDCIKLPKELQKVILFIVQAKSSRTQFDWSRGLQYISYFTLNIAFYKLKEIAAVKQAENIF